MLSGPAKHALQAGPD